VTYGMCVHVTFGVARCVRGGTCGATISTFQHFFSITEAAAALFSADATDVVRTRPAHLTDAIFCAKHALMPDMSAFSKEPQASSVL
jgi:hypothetical protein